MNWSTTIKTIDIETGEIISYEKLKKEYIIIKTKKHVTFNEKNTRGHIEYTKLCRKRPKQGILF